MSIGMEQSVDAPARVLRLPRVQARTGLARSTIYVRVADGSFPQPIRLGARAVGWIESQVGAGDAAAGAGVGDDHGPRGDGPDARRGEETLPHTASGGGYSSVAEDLDVTVTDDDEPGLELSKSSLGPAEGESDSYTVALATQPGSWSRVVRIRRARTAPDRRGGRPPDGSPRAAPGAGPQPVRSVPGPRPRGHGCGLRSPGPNGVPGRGRHALTTSAKMGPPTCAARFECVGRATPAAAGAR